MGSISRAPQAPAAQLVRRRVCSLVRSVVPDSDGSSSNNSGGDASDAITFLFRLQPGPCPRSYGLQVCIHTVFKVTPEVIQKHWVSVSLLKWAALGSLYHTVNCMPQSEPGHHARNPVHSNVPMP